MGPSNSHDLLNTPEGSGAQTSQIYSNIQIELPETQALILNRVSYFMSKELQSLELIQRIPYTSIDSNVIAHSEGVRAICSSESDCDT
jgi:hypothetical protein